LQKTHPYALLWPVNSDGWYRLLISSELPYAVTTDNGNYLHFAGQYGFCDNSPKPYKWTDIDCYAGPHTGYAPGAVVWSNFDLYYEDGTLVCAASEPVPTTSWDYVIATKFDGEVTTVANDDGTACVSDYQLYADGASLYSSCAYRITVDRATTVEDIQGSYSLGHYLGNPYLADSANFEDNGGAWCIKESTKYVSGSGFLSVFYFYTKEPGTYQLKLESVRG